jgi:hypothetical protein
MSLTIPKRLATYARHYCEPPQQQDKDGSKHWITRAANFVTVVSELNAGAHIARSAQDDEYMCFVVSGQAHITSDHGSCDILADTLAIIPPGKSLIEMHASGLVITVFSNKAHDLLARASNAKTYADGAPEITPITPWPDPIGGFKLRTYKLSDFTSPDPSPLKMRIFRSTNLMINIFEPWTKRRDPHKLSPHWHDDFEQMSLGLKGSFVHHMRYPWGPDMTTWIDDEHAVYDASPSILVIPAGVIHTTQDTGEGTTWLVDIFGPPRMDFSSRAGFVLNEQDYPLPNIQH